MGVRWVLFGCAALAVGAVAQDSCNGYGTTLVAQPNTQCVEMNITTEENVESECCGRSGNPSLAPGRLLQRRAGAFRANDESCRITQYEKAYCADPSCPLLSAEDKLRLNLQVGKTDRTENCCATCKCFGDPECVAFNGDRDEWIVCHGVSESTCSVTKGMCESTKDHAGRSCKWLKPNNWESWEASGSPCQPNFALSGSPEMNMYTVDSFSLDLVLGERGVIKEARIQTTADDEQAETYVLSSDNCFDFDPRVVGEERARDAWYAHGGKPVPESWMVYAQAGTVEVRWFVADRFAGVNVEIVCTRAFINGNIGGLTRLNIESVTETDTSRSGTGFCATGKIHNKNQTPLEEERYKRIHDKCASQLRPELLTTCFELTGKTCSMTNVEANIMAWCGSADLSRTSQTSPEECVATLTSGTVKERSRKWMLMVCHINNDEPNQCVTEIAQFGWKSYLMSGKSNGIPDPAQVPILCAPSASDYSKNDDACARGVRVEYFGPDGWTQEFFVPNERPPCGGVLVVNGASNPNLFKYKVRIAQCALDSSCLLANGCEPSPGFGSSLTFTTDNCPTPKPTESPTGSPTKSPTTKSPTKSPTSSPTDAPTKSPTFRPTLSPQTAPPTPEKTVGPVCFQCNATEESAPQYLCDNGSQEFTNASTCENCCTADTLFTNPDNELLCREVFSNGPNGKPFCNRFDAESKARCELLEENNGVLDINLSFENDGNQGGESCCRTCSCWGDPHCTSFSGQQKSWVVCDGRSSSTCEVSRNVCLAQKDQNGNQCSFGLGRCKVNSALSGEPDMVMFETGELGNSSVPYYKARIMMGYLGVITQVEISNDNARVLLDAPNCVNFVEGQIPEKMFQIYLNAFPGVPAEPYDGLLQAVGLNVTVLRNPIEWKVSGEYNVYVFDKNSQVFLEMTCIKRSNNGMFSDRINVNNLIDANPTRVLNGGGEGYCVSNSINQLEATFNTAAEVCWDDNVAEKAADLCSALSGIPCQFSTLHMGVYKWCDSANVFTGVTNDKLRVEKCINSIIPKRTASRVDLYKNWRKMYCESISSARSKLIPYNSWIKQCESSVAEDGGVAMVQAYGAGVKGPSMAPGTCGVSEDSYPPVADHSCDFGIAIEYFDEQQQKWIEEMFVPASTPPCQGKLQVTYNKHPRLFEHRWRAKQCDIDHLKCDFLNNCSPAQGFTFAYRYKYPQEVCTASVSKARVSELSSSAYNKVHGCLLAAVLSALVLLI